MHHERLIRRALLALCIAAFGCDDAAKSSRGSCTDAAVEPCSCEAGGAGERTCSKGEFGACACIATTALTLTGRIFDAETGLAIENAALMSDTGDSARSDTKGHFELPAMEDAKSVEVSKPNYVASVKRPPAKGGYMEVFIKDIDKTADFDAEKGVKAMLDSGATVEIPGGALRDAKGAAVTGMVTLTVADVDGGKRAQASALPGDLRGKNEKGDKGRVSVQRALDIRITDSKGEDLQVSARDNVVAEFPAKEGDAPERTGLSYDKKKEAWIEEGKAKRTVNAKGEPVYRKDIDHLSWHGYGEFFTKLSCLKVCVEDGDKNRLGGAQVWLVGGSFPGVSSVFTGDDGCVSEDAPISQDLVLVGQTAAGVSKPQPFTTSATEQSVSDTGAQCDEVDTLVIGEVTSSKCPSGFEDCGERCAANLAECTLFPATCAAPTSGPTMHMGSNVDEIWTADQSPHVIPFDLSVNNYKITLEPCAEVQIAPRASVTVRGQGSISGIGTASTPILIHEREPGQAWRTMSTVTGGRITLAYATIRGGGEPSNRAFENTGMLYGQGSSEGGAPKDTFSLRHVTLAGSKSQGVVLENAQFSDDSLDLTIMGSAGYPINISPNYVGSLPTGAYTGNALDEILLGPANVLADTTMHDRGVPYHVGTAQNLGGRLQVQADGGSPVATLTIEPGVVIRFKKDATFYIQFFTGETPASGALIARGTAEKPIVFTSAEATPAPSDWKGLRFGGLPNPANVLDYVRVEYAGQLGAGGYTCLPPPDENSGAISILTKPATGFITNTTVAHSLYQGISSGWRGDPVDFVTSNTFEDIAGCKVTNPPPTNSDCDGVEGCALR